MVTALESVAMLSAAKHLLFLAENEQAGPSLRSG
jgi:hypothetical protein